MLKRKLELEESYNPAYKYLAKVYVSMDNGKTWHNTADERLCNSETEAIVFYQEYMRNHNVA